MNLFLYLYFSRYAVARRNFTQIFLLRRLAFVSEGVRYQNWKARYVTLFYNLWSDCCSFLSLRHDLCNEDGLLFNIHSKVVNGAAVKQTNHFVTLLAFCVNLRSDKFIGDISIPSTKSLNLSQKGDSHNKWIKSVHVLLVLP